MVLETTGLPSPRPKKPWLPHQPVKPRPQPTGFDRIVHYVVGLGLRPAWSRPRLRRTAQAAMRRMQVLQTLSEAQLREEIVQQRINVRREQTLDGTRLIEAIATIGEVASRVLHMRPYPVQMMGAMALHQGYLAEMATGEGKSLVAAMAGVLSGWSGHPCHLLTANDYLAERDAQEMTPLYEWCGLNVVSVTEAVPHVQRPERYQADVVYMTAKELLGDFLRDKAHADQGLDESQVAFRRWLQPQHMTAQPWGPLLLVRGIHSVVIDEIDSLLIDEAVTPLILSLPREDQNLQEAVLIAARVAESLSPQQDYQVLEQQKTIILRTPALEAMAQVNEALPRIWQAAARREELLRQALIARHFFVKDQHYVVQDEKIILLDEFTGRLTPQRTLSAGLHQALEAHQALPITAPTETLGQMSFQTFFRYFPRIAGTTGTAREAIAEFWGSYNLRIVSIPSHRPVQRIWQAARIFRQSDLRWQAVVQTVTESHAKGQPVLIGVRSVAASEQLAHLLSQQGLTFALLNATRHEYEAEIVATAGQIGAITIATNMAGRGTDIKLGTGVAALGGLQVVIVEYNDSERVDRQLAGRCGRQGDPGQVRVFLSLEDELIKRYLPKTGQAIVSLAKAFFGPMSDPFIRLAFRLAQSKAQRQARARRAMIVKNDEWLQKALPFL